MDIEQVNSDFENGTLICRVTIGKVIAMARQAAKNKLDADRYRALRQDSPHWYVAIQVAENKVDSLGGEELDAAIDRVVAA